jgi:two-component system, NtrC family, nitrogen regulation sensor histidine kinase GlnL
LFSAGSPIFLEIQLNLLSKVCEMTTEYRFTLDRKLRVKSWDEHLEEITGEPTSAALGKKYHEVFPRLIYRDRDAAAYAVEHGKKVSMKKYGIHCLSFRATADIVIQPIPASNGVKGVSVSILNVSLSNGYTAGDIRHLISIGKAASSIAHGVRNPLNALQGAVTVISRKYSEEKILMEFARIMQEEISRLDEFVTKFLSGSVREPGPYTVDINALLKKVETLISYQAHVRNIRSNFCYGQIPPALVNPFQVEQAVLNIINNAMEALENDGGLTVKTELSRYFENDFIEIEISDDGPGIRQDSRSEPSTRRLNGKGYGLKITEEIMQHCGGRMQIHSITGKGTSVKLFVPAKI